MIGMIKVANILRGGMRADRILRGVTIGSVMSSDKGHDMYGWQDTAHKSLGVLGGAGYDQLVSRATGEATMGEREASRELTNAFKNYGVGLVAGGIAGRATGKGVLSGALSGGIASGFYTDGRLVLKSMTRKR